MPTDSAGRRGTWGQWALFLVMATVWGSSFFWTALALRSFHYTLIVMLRMGIAALVLGTLVLATGTRLPRSPRDYAVLAALALVNITIPFTMITWGQQYVSSSLTSVLSSTTPLFVFALTSLSGRDEKFSILRLIGTCGAFAGIAVLSLGAGGGQDKFSVGGVLMVLGSSVVYAFGNIFSRKVTRTHPALTVACLQSAIGCLLEIPIVTVSGGWTVTHDGALPVLALIWLGVMGSGLTYLLYFHFIRTWGSTRTAMNTYFQPAVGVLLGVLILGEAFTAPMVLGLFLTAAGVAVFLWGTRRMVAVAARRPRDRLVARRTVARRTGR